MPKESYYFPHDYDAQGDPKLQALISEYKSEGYGIYWAIIEMLHKETTHKLPLKKYVFSAIAKQMLTSAEQVQSIVNFAMNECELFEECDGFFYSNRVLKNFEIRQEISEKRSIAGRLGAIAKQNLANASKGKERKGKERKTIKSIYKLNIEDRMTEFELEVMEHKGEYSPEILQEFWDYWSELNKNKTKMKKELQQTWDTSRRLKTWIRNKEKFEAKNGTGTSKQRRKDYVTKDEYESGLKKLYEGGI